jgi:glycosyltransferase involved in cell wall biosynthesis
MKVLHVLVGAAARTGGPPAFVGGASVELAKLSVDVRILATDTALAPWGLLQRQRRIRPDEIEPGLAQSDLRLSPARFPRRLANSPALAAELDRTVADFDVIHVHNLWQFPQRAGYRAALRHGVPYVVSPHGSLDPYLRRRGRLRKALTTRLWQGEMLDRATALHVTTDAERELIEDVAPGVRRVVVPCGVHVAEFSDLPDRDLFRRDRLGGYDGPVVMFFGRVTDKKGVDVLIRAFAQVRREHQSRLVIVGPDDSGLVPKLRRIAEEVGLAEADVEFTGPVFGEERLAALATADVWALSSHTENFGIAVVEAAAARCPVVISPGVNLAPDLEDARAGLVAEATPDAFAAGLLEVLTDDSERARLRDAGTAWAARYDWSVVAPQLVEMYRSVAESVGSGR